MSMPCGDDFGLMARNRSPQEDHQGGQDREDHNSGAERLEILLDQSPVGAEHVAEADNDGGPDYPGDYLDGDELARAHPGEAGGEGDEGASDRDETADEDGRTAPVLEIML